MARDIPGHRAPAPKRRQSFFFLLKRYFFAGVAAVFPLVATCYIVVGLFKLVDGFGGRFIKRAMLQHFGYTIPGLGMVLTFSVIILIGLLSRMFLLRRLLPWMESLLLKVPLVASIYPSTKQLSDFLFSGRGPARKFRKVVLVEYPYRGAYALGFITNEAIAEFDAKSGKKLVSVFVPLAPSPISGIIMLVAAEQMTELELSVDQAIKFIVSGGIVGPVPPQNGRETAIVDGMEPDQLRS